MKEMLKSCILAGLMGYLGMLPFIPRAEAGYFTEDFESYNTLPTNVVDIGKGWGASSNNVVVESFGGTKAANLPPGQFMTNAVATNGNWIWTQAWLNGTNFITPDSLPDANTAAVFEVGLSTNGYLYVCNPTSLAWDVCTTDATNGPAVIVSTGTWAKVIVFQNYQNHKVHIFLNDQLIRKEFSFINTNSNNYATLGVYGAGDGNVHVDNIFVSNSTPPGLVSDSDNDGRPDAEELTLFGSLTTWSGARITASVTNNTGGTVSPTDTGATVKWQGQTNFTFVAAPAYCVDRVWTNGVVVLNISNQLLRTAGLTWSNITADDTVTVGYWYEGSRYVQPGDYATVSSALAASLAGDRIVISNGNYSETATVNSNVTLIGTNLTGLTGFTVQTGVTVTVSGFTNLSVAGTAQVGTNGTLVVSNSVLNLGSLVVQSGGFVYGYNSTATVNGVQYRGTFVIDQFGTIGLQAAALDFSEGFETYSVNQRLDHLQYFGWNASGSSAIVTNNPDSGNNATAQAAMIPAGLTVSNLVNASDASLTNIWTDVLVRGAARMESPDLIDTNGSSPVMFYVGTNGYLVVLTPSGWDVCSNDVWAGGQAPTIGTNEWAEVSWFMDYGAQTVAYFVKGHLVRQGSPFAKPASHYHGLGLDANWDTTWLDSVSIWTNVPTALTNGANSDLDHDGIPDAVEIAQRGTVFDKPMLATPTVTAVDTNGATLFISITNNGGAPVTSSGSVWGPDAGTVANPSASLVMTGMLPGQHVYARGWASNSIGVAYSAACEFYTEPVQATNITYVPVAGGFTISWTADATSTGTVVVVKPDTEAYAYPLDGSNYQPNASYGSGGSLGTSNFIVYAGNGTSVTVDSLVYGVHYTAAAYAYAGSGMLIQYRTNNPATIFLQWPPQGTVFKIR